MERTKAGTAPGPILTTQDRYRNCLRLNASYGSAQAEEALAKLGRVATEMTSS